MAEEFITIKELTGTVIVPYKPEMTMREYMIFIGDNFMKGAVHKNSFQHSLITNGKATNSYENRHKLVKELIKASDTLFSTGWVLGSPNNAYVYKGNLNADHQERNTECPVCLEKIDLSQSKLVYGFECLHFHHYQCITKLKKNCCPMCNEEFDQNTRAIIDDYAKNGY